MEKRAIDVAKALVRLSEVTIFELRNRPDGVPREQQLRKRIAVRARTNAAGMAIAYAGGYVVCMRTSPFSAVAVSMPGSELARAHVPCGR
jgi:hypothetical protein